ncbi:MAG: DUF547 domain-containing protein [Elusimicrobia bacterium]|nr:DUF547 domain-containing protein [Elusimicrobiota bacterium]
MKSPVVLTAVAIVAFASLAQGGSQVDHSVFNRLLQSYVKDGKVNYEGFKRETSTFQTYLEALKNAQPESLPTKEAKLAFWINAYNACVIKGVLDRYPLKSVQDVPGFFDKLTYEIAGELLTPNAIENNKVRSFKDFRVHFALVCASSSCPFLRPETYIPERLDAQLDDQARRFLADPNRGLRLDEVKGELWLSQIFNWYAADFVDTRLPGFLAARFTPKKILNTLTPYLPEPLRQKVTDGVWSLRYMPYDWTLNR